MHSIDAIDEQGRIAVRQGAQRCASMSSDASSTGVPRRRRALRRRPPARCSSARSRARELVAAGAAATATLRHSRDAASSGNDAGVDAGLADRAERPRVAAEIDRAVGDRRGGRRSSPRRRSGSCGRCARCRRCRCSRRSPCARRSRVVADLDLVVELHVVLDHRVVDRAAVDRGVGADLAVVADEHAADLRDLAPSARRPRPCRSRRRRSRRRHARSRARRSRSRRRRRRAGGARASSPMRTSSPMHACRADRRAPAPTRARAPITACAPTRRRGVDRARERRRRALACDAGGAAAAADGAARRRARSRVRIARCTRRGSAVASRIARRDDHRAGAASRASWPRYRGLARKAIASAPACSSVATRRTTIAAVAVEPRAGRARRARPA